jgi:hypothetical protein
LKPPGFNPLLLKLQLTYQVRNWFQAFAFKIATCASTQRHVSISLTYLPVEKAAFNHMVVLATVRDVTVGLYKLNTVVTRSLKAPGYNPSKP